MSRHDQRPLSMSERAGVRNLVLALTEQNGGSHKKAAETLGFARSTFATYAAEGQRSWRISDDVLGRLALAGESTVADVLTGRGPKPAKPPRHKVHQVRNGGGMR